MNSLKAYWIRYLWGLVPASILFIWYLVRVEAGLALVRVAEVAGGGVIAGAVPTLALWQLIFSGRAEGLARKIFGRMGLKKGITYFFLGFVAGGIIAYIVIRSDNRLNLLYFLIFVLSATWAIVLSTIVRVAVYEKEHGAIQ